MGTNDRPLADRVAVVTSDGKLKHALLSLSRNLMSSRGAIRGDSGAPKRRREKHTPPHF